MQRQALEEVEDGPLRRGVQHDAQGVLVATKGAKKAAEGVKKAAVKGREMEMIWLYLSIYPSIHLSIYIYT